MGCSSKSRYWGFFCCNTIQPKANSPIFRRPRTRELFNKNISKMFPSSKGFHTAFFHEGKDVITSVLVKGHKKPLKFRYLFFRDNQHSPTL